MRVRLNRQKLAELMANSPISQNHWAMKVGLSKGHWSQIVNGRHPYPSAKTRERMLEAFGVEFEELFTIEDDATGPAEGDFAAALAERYVIDREVGEGGMGVVYLARDVKHGRAVAIKVVAQEAISAIGVEQFLKEIRTTGRLQHPHVIPLYDSGVAAGHPYYVTPYCESGSLRDVLRRRGRIPLAESLDILAGVAKALTQAHHQDILHCDIKPENILLAGDHPFVADFGIARALHLEYFEWGRRNEIDSSAGTPAYVSPEQAAGEEHLTPRSDVYSMACVAFEMLAGSPPFTGRSTMQVISRRFIGDPPDIRSVAPDVPRSVAYVLAQAMDFSSGKRPETPDAFVAQLRQAASGSPSTWLHRITRAGVETRTWVRSRLGREARTPIWGIGAMENIWHDFRLGLRSLRRSPLFTLITLVTLGLGIGATTAIYTVVEGVLLKPLPYDSPEQLVAVGRSRPPGSGTLSSISPWHFRRMRDENRTFENLAAATFRSTSLTGQGDPMRAPSFVVSGDWFEVFRVQPLLGRLLQPEDDVGGAPPVVVLSEPLWRSYFGADPETVGSTIMVDGSARTVVGVAPASFAFRGDPSLGSPLPQLWLPFAWDLEEADRSGSNYLRLFGRLAPGETADNALADLQSVWAGLEEERPAGDNLNFTAWVRPLLPLMVRNVETPLKLLSGAAALVLLIAAVNVANLLLARAESRSRETAVRAALGAGRKRLAWFFVSETMLVALGGGLIGVLLATLGVRVLVGMVDTTMPRHQEIVTDGGTMAFALATSLLVGTLVALVPVFHLGRNNMAHDLKEGGRAGSGRSSRLRASLVVAELALALMLTVGAGLLLRSFVRLSSVDLGLAAQGVGTFSLSLPESRYPTGEDAERFVSDLFQRIEALPGVQSVGLTNRVPFRRGNWNSRITESGNPDNAVNFTETRWITEGTMAALGIPLLQGRDFSAADRAGSPPVVLVNAEFAKQMFGEENPIGRGIRVWGEGGVEIVGVVGNVREFGPANRLPPAVYWPYGQRGDRHSFTVVLRTTGDPGTALQSVRALLREADQDLPMAEVSTLSATLQERLGDRRFLLTLIGAFAAVAVVLGAVGIYGVMAYSVEQQRREMGIRLALGAESGTILRLILGRGLRLAVIGAVAGVAGAMALHRIMSEVLFEVSGRDPATLAITTVVMGTVALLACWLPARRAAASDPMVSLRAD